MMLDHPQAEGRNEIAEIEARIEDLERTLDGCHKVDLASKAAIIGGAIWLLLTIFGITAASGLHLIVALALLIGGIVAFGSNTSTVRETRARMAALEARRTELIDQIDPRLVTPGWPPTWLPRQM